MQSLHLCMRTWRLEMTRTEFLTLVMSAALSTMPQMMTLRLMLTMVREAQGWMRPERSITLRSISSMDTGEEGPIEDGGGIMWTSVLYDIIREDAGVVENAGSAGWEDRLVEEAESTDGGGKVRGPDEKVEECFRGRGLKSAGPVED